MAIMNNQKVNAIQLLTDEFLLVTQKAAVACYPWIGRGNKIESDRAATEAMRNQLKTIPMNAKIVIGEGEMDEAPMLYIGEDVGTGYGPGIDIAVDPVEGTTLMATGQDHSLVVIAAAEKDSLLHAPDMYMEKIAVGPKAKGCIDLNAPLTENMVAVARALGKDMRDLTVMIQDRPRHEYLMKQVFESGARVKLFSDVDITGAISTAIDQQNVDLLVGTGGAPEGVIAAVALKCLGGDFQARLVPQNQGELDRCIKMGITNPEKALRLDDLVKTDNCFFVGTGITNGHLLKGVEKKENGKLETHSLVSSFKNEMNMQFITSEM
ncbi:class II fructose-bisphosphatase [Alkalihalobacillus sp. R86527]|uniref:class II fructose-bisphosphatase n=1 Tax=Alkalihalobacillus sp. R86527 TaxID=3093863 RepID=UPI0036716731